VSGVIVHGVPGRPYVRAALLTLEEKGAPYKLAPMAPGTLKQEPHLSRHPLGRIPAFGHDGRMPYETRAICAMSTRSCPARGCSRKSPAPWRGWTS
jgi:glutathione S-transferase